MMSKPQAEPQKLTDHRDIGTQLDLFSFHDVAPGAPFWHPRGMVIFRELEKAAREMNDNNGYLEINTPILVRKEVFEKSGHWDHYRGNMFYFNNPREEKEMLVVKPMNCPESAYIYNARVRSYRDLPLRLAEIGRLNRNELSGTLGGLFRVRQLTMDDAHIYLTPEQVEGEVIRIIRIIDNFYSIFGFKTEYTLATKPADFLGTKEEWELAEAALEKGLKKAGVKYSTAKGEGAFYGPKIETHLKDSQGRDWQMGTAQLDLVMLPKQFNITYTAENGSRLTPWVIHRAIFGSFERFIGILLEHTGGNLPTWLSPVQVRALAISEDQHGYALQVMDQLKSAGVRVELDISGETISKKIREAELQKIPYSLVVGEKETNTSTVAVRQRGKGDTGAIKLGQFVTDITKEIAERG